MKKILIGIASILFLVLGIRISFASVETVTVPEPSTIILLGSGLAGFFFFRKKFKK